MCIEKNSHFSLQTKLCISPFPLGDQTEKREVYLPLSLISLKGLLPPPPPIPFLFQLSFLAMEGPEEEKTFCGEGKRARNKEEEYKLWV